MRRLASLIAAAPLFISFAGSAAAVDGVIEINETSVTSGGITPGDLPGYPATLTQPGSYRLTGNLELRSSGTTGILVAADDVTIDLNGFGIVGTARCTSYKDEVSCVGDGLGSAIYAQDDRSVAVRTTVRNGFVRGAGHSGIRLNAESAVDFVTVTDNAQGGIEIADDSLVTRSRIVRNGGDGIRGIGPRVAIADNVITQSEGMSVDNTAELSGNLCDDQDCTEKRSFYLTAAEFYGDQPIAACDPGFHFANFFEISDPSKLVYDTRRGLVEHDSGSGPPTGNPNRGWVRTGSRNIGGNVNVVGYSQCSRWSDNTPNEFGSTAYLGMNATGDEWPWTLETFPCSYDINVWCVEDH
ncbi:MAG: hypothetical protein AB8G23_02890 [Myxococcota bacterium]